MRNNVPVIQREYELADDVTLMSVTDTRSHVIYANAAFIEVSGFDRDEIIGAPRNFVRHPDMQPQAFADMWANLGSGLSWTALVKNRRRNGDYKGVRAAFPRGIVHGSSCPCAGRPDRGVIQRRV